VSDRIDTFSKEIFDPEQEQEQKEFNIVDILLKVKRILSELCLVNKVEIVVKFDANS